MPEGTAAIIERFYDAWNRHDAAAVAASFAAGGVHADPLTRVDLSGDNLTDHVQSVLEVIRDLRISLVRTIADGATVKTATSDPKRTPLTVGTTLSRPIIRSTCPSSRRA